MRKINYKIILLIIATAILLPSIVYLINEKTIVVFNSWFTFFLRNPKSYFESIFGAIIFGLLFLGLIFCYFKLIKRANYEFKDIKHILIYVLILSCIFGIMLPFTTSDIFYYMGTRMD